MVADNPHFNEPKYEIVQEAPKQEPSTIETALGQAVIIMTDAGVEINIRKKED